LQVLNGRINRKNDGGAEKCRNPGFGCAFSALRLVDDYGDDYGGRFWSGHS